MARQAVINRPGSMPGNRQNNQITEFSVDGQKIKLSSETVKKYLVSGNPDAVTDQEVMMFIALCKAQKLNPFVKDAYLIKYGSAPATIVTSIGAMEKRAVDYEAFDGIESGIAVVQADGSIDYRNGALVLPDEQVVGGWATVYRKDRSRPTHVELSISEYIQRKGDGSPNSTWASKPATMIRKCAKACALREAFPKENAGLYERDEIDTHGSENCGEPMEYQLSSEGEVITGGNLNLLNSTAPEEIVDMPSIGDKKEAA